MPRSSRPDSPSKSPRDEFMLVHRWELWGWCFISWCVGGLCTLAVVYVCGAA